MATLFGKDKAMKEVSDYYKTIYVLSEGADLHVFETDIGIYQNIKIESAEQSDRNIRARQMVEDAEENF